VTPYGTVLNDALVWALMVCRISGMMLLAPFYGARNLPTQVTVGLSLILAAVAFPLAPRAGITVPANLAALLVAGGTELAVGLLLGFSANLLFAAVQLAGQLADQELGFGLANVIDPVSNEQVTIVGQFKFILGMLFFLALDGHHLVLQAVVRSFTDIPVLGLAWGGADGLYIADRMVAAVFAVAVKLAAPAVVTLFLVTVAMGLLARTAPEMNVFILGFSVRVGVGLGVLALAVPVFAALYPRMQEAFIGTASNGALAGPLAELMRLMAK
jgi:flagellar biosynthetic protein FliR